MSELQYPGGLTRLPHNFWANVKFKSRTRQDILTSPVDGSHLIERLNALPGTMIHDNWIYEQCRQKNDRNKKHCMATVIRDCDNKTVILHSDDEEIIFRAIERLGRKNTAVKRPKMSQSYSVELRPVSKDSIILQRLGGMRRNISLLTNRIATLEKEVAELKKDNAEKEKIIAARDKKYAQCRIAILCVWDMLKEWVGNNFPNDPLPESAQFLVPPDLNDAAKELGAVCVGDPEQYFLAEDIIEYKRKLDNGEIDFGGYTDMEAGDEHVL